MRWLPLLLTIAAAPADAERSYAWGDLHDMGGLSSVQIELCDDGPCWARVTYDNRLGSGQLGHAASLRIGGVAVHFRIDQGPDQAPDAFAVTPPRGFYAVPPNGLLVEDDTIGVIEIFPEATS